MRIIMSLPTRGRYAQQAIESAVETLARVNFAYLADNPDTPTRQQSDVKYQREGRKNAEEWQSIPELLDSGVGDCEDLAAWEIAQLRRRGIRAQPHVVPVVGKQGKWHVLVRVKIPGQSWAITDPSKDMGM